MRKKLIAANWKMNFTLSEVEDWLIDFSRFWREKPEGVMSDVILFPPAVYLSVVQEFLLDMQGVLVGAQNLSSFSKGAYTGEISAVMLTSMQVPYVLVGHSERRNVFHETDSDIQLKVQQALQNGLSLIFCCGEPMSVRQAGQHLEYVAHQVKSALQYIPADQVASVAIAYEPVWAIGTGLNATPLQAQEMHSYIRSVLTSLWGEESAIGTRILYGGSCNAQNAEQIFTQPDVDGGLIGSASLAVQDFVKIIQIAHELH